MDKRSQEELTRLATRRRNLLESHRENNCEEELRRLLTDLYPDNAHFVYELLQNAEDAQATEVSFVLRPGSLTVTHNGKRLFNVADVDSITSIGASTKRDEPTKIGKFGVG